MLRVHLGCAGVRLDGWLNVESDPRVGADVYADPFDFVAEHGPEIGELYMGHLLEALSPDDATALLRLTNSRAAPGTAVAAAATDVRAACAAFAAGEIGIEQFNRSFAHRAFVGRQQRWSFDAASLLELFRQSGLEKVTTADLATLPDAGELPPEERRWRCAASGMVAPHASHDGAARSRIVEQTPVVALHRASTAESALLDQLSAVRAELDRLRSREQAALRKAGKADRLAVELVDTQRTLDAINRSISFRVAHRGSLVARRVLPAGSPQRRLAARVAIALTPSRRGHGYTHEK